MQKIFLALLIFILPLQLFSQTPNSVWWFGWHAGIDFSSGTAVPIYSPMYQLEGCATICDSTGNLLFATNGFEVLNSTGAVMDTGLYGDWTSTQSALIVPFPGNTDKYYIFTTDGYGWYHGLNYSVVDMTMNGGLGDVVSFNTQLVTPCAEKLTAVRNTNGTDFWVISHAYPGQDFYVYPVTAAGVGAPVITTIGDTLYFPSHTMGCIRCSPDGQKLAMVNWVQDQPYNLFDFNASTGVISNYLEIPNIWYTPYGVIFSPDNTKLYVTYNGGNGMNIRQYDLTQANFQNNPVVIYEQSMVTFSTMQTGPDGRIYVAEEYNTTMGVINNPNAAGAACDFQDSIFYFPGGARCRYGLPNFFENYFYPTCNISDSANASDAHCYNTNTGSIDLTVYGGVVPFTYMWSNGATTQDLQNIPNGSYSVTVTDYMGCTDTSTSLISEPPALILTLVQGSDTIYCNAVGGTPVYSYHWSMGDTTSFIDSATAGTYSVSVTDMNGCVKIKTIVISGVMSVSDESGFSFYPNPVSDEASISIPMNKNQSDVAMEIFSVEGKNVSADCITKEIRGGELIFHFRKNNLQAGIYFYRIKENEKILAQGKIALL